MGNGRTSHTGEKIPVDIKIGDTVIFSKFAPIDIVDPDTKIKYLLISERDIIAVV